MLYNAKHKTFIQRRFAHLEFFLGLSRNMMSYSCLPFFKVVKFFLPKKIMKS